MIMKEIRIARITVLVTAALTASLLLGGTAVAQSTEVQGLIDGRSGATMALKSQDTGTNVVVLLTDDTQVDEVEGALHMRKKQLGMAALVPGLPVRVKGTYNAQNQLVADSVKFKGSDLKTAQDIQAGVVPQQQQLAQQQAQLQQQQQAVQHQEVAAAQAKIDANNAAIAAANKRFGELGDYNILDEVTVLFANGKVAIEPQYEPQLLALIQKAKTIDAYVIEVKGYASSVGSAALNQKLSTERADNVTDFLEQNGIPLTHAGSRRHGHQQSGCARRDG
jgi:outer membrane protein OmpA-like peptidoglycan-associated protein